MLANHIIERAVRRVPDKIGLIYGERSYTFRQMGERASRLANALLNMGLNKGDRVATIIPNTPEFHEIFFATAKTGLVFVPVNYHYVGEEIEYAINNVEASVLLVDERYLGNVKRVQLPSVKHLFVTGTSAVANYEDLLAEYTTDSPRISISGDDLALIMYTSGTTSRPKGVMHSYRSLYWLILACGPMLHIRPEQDVCLVAGTSYHLAACHKVLTTTYFLNTAIIMDSFDPKVFLQTIEKYKVTNIIAPLVPRMVTRLVDDPDFGKYDLSSLRAVFIGVANIPLKLLESILDAFGDTFYNLYGSTEGGGIVTLMEPGELKRKMSSDRMDILNSCGREPYGGGEIKIVNEAGEVVKPGEIGEILLRGNDMLMKGYWKMPEETAKVVDSDGWYHSADLATIDKEGYIYIKGRKTDVIRSGGENISPLEIEEVIQRHPAVKEVVAIGVPDESWGESVRAVVTLEEGKTASEQEIIDFCKQYMASYKKPKSVVFVDALPLGPSGVRVSRKLVREQYSQPSPGESS